MSIRVPEQNVMTEPIPEAQEQGHVVLIWRNLGPYHLARAQAAAKRLKPLGLQTVVVELAGAEASRDWQVDRADPDLTIQTLAPGRTLDRGKLRLNAEMQALLDALAPRCVAVAGYDRPEMRLALQWAHREDAVAVLMSETKWDDKKRVWWKHRMTRHLVRHVDAALVSGGPAGEYMVTLGVPRELVFRQYGAVDNAFFEQTSQAEREAGMRPAHLPLRPYFLACARLIEERKNMKPLLLAYEAYRAGEGAAAWDLVICGDGPDRAMLEAFALEHALEGVHFAGFQQVDALAVYYAHAGAFVHPAVNEAWGLVVNEAMAAGLPVLVSRRCGCAYDLVRDGVNGYGFDPSNVEDIARTLTTMSRAAPEVRAGLGKASQAMIDAWGPERFAGGLVDAIRAVEARRPEKRLTLAR